MTPRKKRLAFVAVGLAAIALAAAFVLNAMRDNLVFFFSPSDVAEGKAPETRDFRLGGMVQKGTVERGADGLTVSFTVTDFARSVPVKFTGILPDLFAEGQGVVAQGRLGPDGTFLADQVLAKHDETYMPPEVADALKRAGKMPPDGAPTEAALPRSMSSLVDGS
jgi:cytochrome c-type biogenesis protein CcmE